MQNLIATELYGKTIKTASIKSIVENVGYSGTDTLILTFTDGTISKIADEAQQCCEDRHMSTDDNLSTMTGEKLRAIELLYGTPSEDSEYVRESAFFDNPYRQGYLYSSYA